jgi:DNA-binding transcriptional LysR family regulator
MVAMNTAQLRQADLNLLVVFAVFSEERNVSAAAKRLFLTQPAMSRALDRLRAMFGDELFVRGRSGYELTPHAIRILKELEETLPKLDRLLCGAEFDPLREEAHFKIACTDHATSILGAGILSRCLQKGSRVNLEFVGFSDAVYRDLEQGHIDLVFQVNDEAPPGSIATEKLFEDEMVCVVSQSSRLKEGISLEQYAAADHVVVSLRDSMQAFPDKRLLRFGIKRKAKLKVPYFLASLEAVESSDLIATVPRRFADKYAKRLNVRVIAAPAELDGFEYLMAWHPRLNSDSAHLWLRRAVRLSADRGDGS